MPETIIVKTYEQEQEENSGGFVLAVITAILVALVFLVEFLVNKGFTTGSAIALIVAVPIIVLILIFKGSVIYERLQDRTSEKEGYIWLGVIIFLILLVLFLQFQPLIIPEKIQELRNKVSESHIESREIIESRDKDSFLELAREKGYPKEVPLSEEETKEICELKCDTKDFKNYSSFNDNIVLCNCEGISYSVDTLTLQTATFVN